MKSLILFTITSLLLFNNKAFPIAPPTEKLGVPNKSARSSQPAKGPVNFAAKPTTEVISQLFGPEPNNNDQLPSDQVAAATTTPVGDTLQSGDLMRRHPETCCNPFAVGQVTLPTQSFGANVFLNSKVQPGGTSEDNAQ